MKNIKDYNLEDLKQELINIKEKPFRAEQIFKWLYEAEVTSFDEMTNLSLELREKLKLAERNNEKAILFIDEIHRLARTAEEYLYPAMEDFVVDLVIGKGPSARSIRIDLPKFTLIGATTRAGQLTTPLRDRFGVLLKLELYTPEQLAEIVKRSASILGILTSDDGAYEIASRSRGTPRIANRLLKRVRDFAMVQGKEQIDADVAGYALDRLEIDELGLDNTDRRMMEAIIKFYDGGPVGLDTLAATIGEEAITIEDVYEPYLMQLASFRERPAAAVSRAWPTSTWG